MPKPKNPAAVALGQRRSRAKTIAARANGAKGGRPREKLPCRVCGTPTRHRDESRRPYDGCA